MLRSTTELEQLLCKEALDKTSDQILSWNKLFIVDQGQNTNTTLPPVDPNTPMKILSLDHALVQARKDAYSRLEQLIDRINDHELQKAQYYITLKHRESCFRFFQMLGLFTLVVVVIIEARNKLQSKRLAQSAKRG